MQSKNCGHPLATYRLQFNRDFRLADAQSLVPYFSRLGITHAYASPILRARQASTHGYDVVDPRTINPNLGDKNDLFSLVTELKKLGLGLVLDVVPNHMAASIENPYWRDVLSYGPSSPFSGWFDIDWRMPDADMWGRVLGPVLGERRSRVLEQDQIRVVWSDGRFLVRYFDHIYPVDPGTVPTICEFGLADLEQSLEADHPALEKIREILAELKKLPKLVARLRKRVNIDRDQTEQWLSQFAQIVMQSPRIQQWAEQTADNFGQGKPGRARLAKLLDSQPYHLVHWRDAARTINYRRFFDINELVSIRQEDPRVFDDTHATLLRWVDDGLIDGIRIDHIDGLRDPLGYLERLSGALQGGERAGRCIPVFVEKILAPDEKLPPNWPVAGTTGYEFLNELEAIFVSPAGFAEIEKQYRRLVRRAAKFSQIASAGKRRVLRNDLSPHVDRLADTLLRLSHDSRKVAATNTADQIEESALVIAATSQVGALANDAVSDNQNGSETSNGVSELTPPELKKRDLIDAVVETIVALPIYRTYVDSNHNTLSDEDCRYLVKALEGARASGRTVPAALDFLGQVLLLENREKLTEHELHERVNFIQRFQQLTSPAAAKGIEDTALYSFVPLVSLNEVGGEPHLPTHPTDLFHQANEERARSWPATMLCVTTHDTKRTADVRARLDVLSEIPKHWIESVNRWRRQNEPFATAIDGKRMPDTAMEYLFYQTVIGLWPASDPRQSLVTPTPDEMQALCERTEGYMLKAAREAKSHTAWTNQNRVYEEALVAFVRKALQPTQGGDSFLREVGNLVARIARPGFWNSLSRTLLQFTSPGTPDLYQGDELWNFALVDPDNRRPVDYELRQRLLDDVIIGIESAEELRREFVQALVDAPEDGRIKLHVVHAALATRRDHPNLFSSNDYQGLPSKGAFHELAIAFARQAADEAALVVAPRLVGNLVAPEVAPLGEVWTDTQIVLPESLRDREWINVLTREPLHTPANGELRLSEVLATFPVALLISRK